MQGGVFRFGIGLEAWLPGDNRASFTLHRRLVVLARLHLVSIRQAWSVVVSVACVLTPAATTADLLRDYLLAADAGECIEDVTYRMIERCGADQAPEVVGAALRALAMRDDQQRALGCDGDIAAQAIAAGADPADVLEATAAGL